MKTSNLKRIIGSAVCLTLLTILGGGTELAAQDITITYRNPTKASPAPQYTCVGDTIDVTATAANIADLILPRDTRWSGDAANTIVSQTDNSITKRFFTYHPYMESDPTIEKSLDFEFTIRLKDNTEKKVTKAIVAKSCPPDQLQTPKVTVTSYGDKYNLGNINFEYVFRNETSNPSRIRIIPAFDPAQPFCLLSSTRSDRNQWNILYRVIQLSDAYYTIPISYNEGDSLRNIIFDYGFYALQQHLDTLKPDAANYCQGDDIVFSLQLSTNWQNVMNQTISNDESKIGACFDWSGSPSPVTFTRRESNKYFFSTKAMGASAGDYRCMMSVNLKYANTKNSPKIDTSFTVTYDVPIVQPKYNEAKGFTQHEISICQGDPLNPNLTQMTDPGATVQEYRDGNNNKILTPGYYIPSKSEEVSAIITAPCPWTDKLKVNVIDASEIYSISPAGNTLICAGDSVTFSATANSPIQWTIMVPTNTDANESWEDLASGTVHKRAFHNDAIVTATVSACGTKHKQFRVQVVQRPDVKMNAEARGCPYTLVNLSGTGGNNPKYSLYDLRNKTDLTTTMSAYLTNAGLKNYPLRPNDSLRLIYTASNQGNAAGYTPSSLTCPASDTAQIIANPTPHMGISDQNTFYTNGETACVPRENAFTLTASGADTYEWLDAPTISQPNRSIELAKDSLIRVRGVENVHHCCDTVTIRCVVSVEKAGRVPGATGCPGEDICFEADELPSTTYAWYNPDNNPMAETTPKLCRQFQVGQDGVYTLKTQRFGCSESLTYNLTLYPAPVITSIVNSPLCVNENLSINYRTGLPDTETPYINFTQDGEPKDLKSGNGDLYLYQQPNVQLSDAGQYILKVTTHNDCAASDTIDVVVEEPAVVRIVLESDTVCESDQTRLRADIATPADNYVYEWYNDNRTIYDAHQSEIEVRWIREDNGPLYLTVHQNACKSHADTTIAVIPIPHLSGMPKDTGICQGQSFCMNPVADIAPEAIQWFWINSDNKLITLPQQTTLPYCLPDDADESINGRYFVLVTHIVGSARCYTRSDTTQLAVYKLPDIRIAGPDFICDQSTVMLRAISNTPGTVRWHHNNSTDDIIHVSEPGRYAVTRISESGGCQDSAEHYLVARALPYFSLPPDTSVCRGSWAMIDGPDGMDAYLWNDGSQDKDHIAEEAGLYILTVARNGCSFTDSIRISMTFCGQFHFPTAFTPNDNRVNDTWGAISSAKDEDMAEYDLMVFDRNGKKVFHGKRISEQWDGRYKGEPCPPGLYMYSFKALEKLDGIKYQSNGTVTIVR